MLCSKRKKTKKLTPLHSVIHRNCFNTVAAPESTFGGGMGARHFYRGQDSPKVIGFDHFVKEKFHFFFLDFTQSWGIWGQRQKWRDICPPRPPGAATVSIILYVSRLCLHIPTNYLVCSFGSCVTTLPKLIALLFHISHLFALGDRGCICLHKFINVENDMLSRCISYGQAYIDV